MLSAFLNLQSSFAVWQTMLRRRSDQRISRRNPTIPARTVYLRAPVRTQPVLLPESPNQTARILLAHKTPPLVPVNSQAVADLTHLSTRNWEPRGIPSILPGHDAVQQ